MELKNGFDNDVFDIVSFLMLELFVWVIVWLVVYDIDFDIILIEFCDIYNLLVVKILGVYSNVFYGVLGEVLVLI